MPATTNSASNPSSLQLLPAFSTRAAYAEHIARVEAHLRYLKEDFRLQWPSNANASTDAAVKHEHIEDQLEVRVGTFEGLIDDDARSVVANYGSPSHSSDRSASPIPSVGKQESASPSPPSHTASSHSGPPYPGWKPIGYVPSNRAVRREPALTQVDNGDHVVWVNAEYARWNFEKMPDGSQSTSSHYTTPENRIPRPNIIVQPPAARPAAAEVAQPQAGPSDVVASVEAEPATVNSDSGNDAGSSKLPTRKRSREDDVSSDDSDARPRKRSSSSDSGSSQPSSPTTSGPRRVTLILGPDPSSSTPRRSPRSSKGKGKETKKGNN